MSLFDSFKEKQHKKARVAALEEAKHQNLVSGKLEPITTATSLEPDEKAYLALTARRMATFDSTIQETTGTIKKQHGIRRAVVGGVLTGSLGGAIVGSTTAGSKIQSTTVDKTVYDTKLVDSGDLVFTDKRVIFSGNNGITSIPYGEVTGASFSGNQVKLKYADMLTDEYYEVFGSEAKDVELYYNNLAQIE